MEIKSMRYFVTVAELSSFRKAAEKLYISQPALSIRIQALEDELGQILLKRSSKGVELTEAGQIMLPAMQAILKKVDELPSLIGRGDENRTQTILNLGIDTIEGRDSVPVIQTILGRMRTSAPNVEFRIARLSHGDCLSKLSDGELEAAIVVFSDMSELVNSGFLYLPLLNENTVMVTRSGPDKDISRILKERVVMLNTDPEEDEYNDSIRNWVSGHSDYAEYAYFSDNATLQYALLYGNAISFVPESYVKQLNDESMTTFSTDLNDWILSLVWRDGKCNPALEKLIRIAKKELSSAIKITT